MDEGLVTYLPRYAESRILEDHDPFPGLIRRYEYGAGRMKEVPLMVKSYMISDYRAYRQHAYYRPATAFYLLHNLLGKEDFHRALKVFIQRWGQKHPTPYDFFFTFEDVLKKNLAWFWKPWFFEFGYSDLAVAGVDRTEKGNLVRIEKTGLFPVPVYLKVILDDGETRIFEESAEVWKDGDTLLEISFTEDAGIDSVILGNDKIPDVFPDNNLFPIVHKPD
jgi:hypothetical protein